MAESGSERLRALIVGVFALMATTALFGVGGSRDKGCAEMSAGSWFHVEYCSSADRTSAVQVVEAKAEPTELFAAAR